MENVYLCLGANLNNPYKTLKKALNLIRKVDGISVKKRSSIYLTSPVSHVPQKDYLNICMLIETILSPVELDKACKNIEHRLGTEPNNDFGPRILGIDILFYGSTKVQKEHLTIPHPNWQKCLFMLIPLYEITSTVIIPGKGAKQLSPIIENFSLLETQKITVYHPTKEVHEPDQTD